MPEKIGDKPEELKWKKRFIAISAESLWHLHRKLLPAHFVGTRKKQITLAQMDTIYVKIAGLPLLTS
jgi:hypothetical protein